MPNDFTFLALFLRASTVVQLVMVVLLIASFWAWSIIVQKLITYAKARREAAGFDASFWSGQPLDELYSEVGEAPEGSSGKIFASGMLEWRRSHRSDGGLIAGTEARIDRSILDSTQDMTWIQIADQLSRAWIVWRVMSFSAWIFSIILTWWLNSRTHFSSSRCRCPSFGWRRVM